MDIEGQYKMLTRFDQIITDTPLATSSMTVTSFKHREAWLHAVTERLRPMFASHGAKISQTKSGLPAASRASVRSPQKNNVWVNAGRMRTARMDIAR